MAVNTRFGQGLIVLTGVVILCGFFTAPSGVVAATLPEHIGTMLRVTARLGFALLLVAYVSRPFFQLSGWGRELLLLRRYVGLSAALSLTVHFGYVVTYLRVSGEPLDLLTVSFGGAGFVLAWAMTLTSSRAAQQKLGTYWRRLHLTGMHYLWLIFMQTFVGRVLAGDSAWAEGMAVLGLVALAIRLSAWLNQRFSRTA
ncbi:MAG: hypothetical protein GWP70_03605 [Proteobacteria bacterium]|nr:hypothetical protein [Pseudomonadota bacterium]